MCEPNIEEIVTYLSTKFNRIFCDREFVCCVSHDFNILRKRNKCRVLIFPTLGPVYQRALKYQAEAFDFATFELSAGIFKTIIAVCHKEYILRKENRDSKMSQEKNVLSESQNTTQDGSGRKRRPERQLYIPPAQRRSTSTKETENVTKQRKCNSSNGKTSKIEVAQIKSSKESITGIRKKKLCNDLVGQEKKVISETSSICEEESASEHTKHPSLMELIKLDLLSLPTYNIVFLKNNIPSLNSFHECFCEFHQYLMTRYKNDLKLGISIFHINNNQVTQLSKDKIGWQTFFPHESMFPTKICGDTKGPLDWNESHFNNNLTLNQAKLCSKIRMRYSIERFKILQNDVIAGSSESDVIFKENSAISEDHKFLCDSELFENIVDLTSFNLGHYFRIELRETEHFHICSQSHDVKNCYMEVKQELLSKVNRKSEEKKCNQEMKPKSDSQKPVQSQPKREELEVIKISEVESKPVIKERKIEQKKIISSKKKCQHDEEIEIMRKTKENINRKTRPLMKYSDDCDDLLKIDKQDNVNNWEDLFDDDGQIQEDLLSEIVHKVGKDMTIVKASEDYTPYMPKSTEDLDHVVEIYDFPSTLTTGDIIHAFNMFDSDSMYVVWIDETHALLVLGSSSQAQKAVEVKNPFIKVRPLTMASNAAMTAASKYDLKPAMKRPQTNLQTARRLITTHLGTKTQISREQRALERENLRKAREQKKIIRQNEKDAWEGNIH